MLGHKMEPVRLIQLSPSMISEKPRALQFRGMICVERERGKKRIKKRKKENDFEALKGIIHIKLVEKML